MYLLLKLDLLTKNIIQSSLLCSHKYGAKSADKRKLSPNKGDFNIKLAYRTVSMSTDLIGQFG